jgi:hypothetical protein
MKSIVENTVAWDKIRKKADFIRKNFSSNQERKMTYHDLSSCNFFELALGENFVFLFILHFFDHNFGYNPYFSTRFSVFDSS